MSECTCPESFAIGCMPGGRSTRISLGRWPSADCPIVEHHPKPPMTDEQIQARLDEIYGTPADELPTHYDD